MPTVPSTAGKVNEAKDRRSIADVSDADRDKKKRIGASSPVLKKNRREESNNNNNKSKCSRLRRRLAETDSATMSLTFIAARAAEAAESAAALINSQRSQRNGNNDGGDGSRTEPLLIVSMRSSFTYESLAFMIRQINFDNTSAKASLAPISPGASEDGTANSALAAGRERPARESFLTPELMRRVASYLTVRPVQQTDVRVIGCSSHDQRHPLESCLTPVDSTWWISGPQTMINGRGREYVEFQLCPANSNESCRRLSSFSLRIPPLPMGPLSVREFELQCRVERFHGGGTDQSGKPNVSYSYRTLPLTTPSAAQNVSGWQDFTLVEPADVSVVRIVCLSNQISRFMDGNNANNSRGTILPMIATPFDQVGFYAIRFA